MGSSKRKPKCEDECQPQFQVVEVRDPGAPNYNINDEVLYEKSGAVYVGRILGIKHTKVWHEWIGTINDVTYKIEGKFFVIDESDILKLASKL